VCGHSHIQSKIIEQLVDWTRLMPPQRLVTPGLRQLLGEFLLALRTEKSFERERHRWNFLADEREIATPRTTPMRFKNPSPISVG
jgi:hypothetical protein